MVATNKNAVILARLLARLLRGVVAVATAAAVVVIVLIVIFVVGKTCSCAEKQNRHAELLYTDIRIQYTIYKSRGYIE